MSHPTTATGDAVHAHHAAHEGGHAVTPTDIAIGVMVGRVAEFFDLFVYAFASVLVFPALLFPFADTYTAMLYLFAIFALAYLVRPLGTCLFNGLERHYGRVTRLTLALLLMTASVVGLLLLPSYNVAGATAIVALVTCRIGQGIAFGGAWDGLAPLLAIRAHAHRRGWYAMLPQLGALVALLVAAALFTFLLDRLPAGDFLAWGWRFPFIVVFAIHLVGLFARLRTVAAPEYRLLFAQHELHATAVPDTLKREARHIFLGAWVPMASFGLFLMVTVFPLCWVFLYTQQDIAGFLKIEIAGATAGILAVILSGFFADRIGQYALRVLMSIGIAIFGSFAWLLLDNGEAGQMAFVVIGFILMGLAFGQSSGAVAYKFAPALRYTASALTSDAAWLLGAAFVPLVALLLASHCGLLATGGYVVVAALCSLLALLRAGKPA